MKILVLSDSHSGMSFMRLCVDRVKPDVLIHLGDFYDDGIALHETYPHIRFYQVPGNCDRFRTPPGVGDVLITPVSGIRFYMTHGHRHRVKVLLSLLLQDARAAKADIVLYGHTHVEDCHREEDGLWVLNPGSCGSYGGSAGLLEIRDEKITSCRILRQEDLERLGN